MAWRILLACLLYSKIFAIALKCDVQRSSTVKFSLSSHRNVTGQWVVQVDLEHAAEHRDSEPWELEIQRTTKNCGDDESILISAAITGPGSTSKWLARAGYEYIRGFGYYKLDTNVKTWQEALKSCEEDGGHLAIINSQEEADALAILWDANPKILNGNKNDWAYVGFHDLYKEGEYLTVFNQSLAGTGYVKWYPGDPQGVNQNCGIVVRRANLLADLPCSEKQPFFCEM